MDLCRGEDICDNWVSKLCMNFKKPTGKPGNTSDRIYHCLAIVRRIQRRLSAAILGVSSGKSFHDNYQGSKESDNFSFGGCGICDDNLEVAAACALRNDDGHEPVDTNEQQPCHNANEEQVEVADVACPQSLPNFIGGCPTVVTTVSRMGGGQGRCGNGRGGGSVNPAQRRSTVDPPQRSPSSLASSRKGGSEKSKNSTNREQGSISKAIGRRV
jgi:hypothetical protein